MLRESKRRQQRKQRAIFDPISHQPGTQASESWEHSHTFKWRVCSKLECNHFKCGCPATDLCSILLKNALARDFFFLGSQFQSFFPIPLWPQPCKSWRQLEPGELQFLSNPVSLYAAAPTVPACLLCSFGAAKQLPLGCIYIYAWGHPLSETKGWRNHAQMDHQHDGTKLESAEKSSLKATKSRHSCRHNFIQTASHEGSNSVNSTFTEKLNEMKHRHQATKSKAQNQDTGEGLLQETSLAG